MKKIVLATMLSMGMMSSAFAVTAQSGVYVGGAAGYSFPTMYNDSTFGQSVTSSNEGFTAGATVGYDYALNQNFLVGAETGYSYYGQQKYDFTNVGDVNFTETGMPLLLTGTYLNQNGFNTFAKAGTVYTYQGENATSNGAEASTSLHAWLPAVAVGVGYMPMQNLNIALQYEHLFGDKNTNAQGNASYKPSSLDAVTLGATYKFAI